MEIVSVVAERWESAKGRISSRCCRHPNASIGGLFEIAYRIARSASPRRTALLALSLLAFTACSTGERGGAGEARSWFDDSKLQPVVLVGELFADNPVIGKASILAVVPPALWVSDGSGDPFLHSLSLDSGNLDHSLGRRGAGPGDFSGVRDISVRPGDSLGIWVYDLTGRRLTRVDPNTVSGSWRVTQWAPNQRYIRVVWLDHNTLLGMGSSDTTRFTLLEPDGSVRLQVRGELVGDSTFPYSIRRGLSTASYLCVRPGGDRFAVTYATTSQVDIFDSKAAKTVSARVPFGDLPGHPAMVYLDSLKQWAEGDVAYYMSCAATTKAIYALFSGKVGDADNPAPFEGWSVHVFDWSGELQRVFSLSSGAMNIAVDGDSLFFTSSLNDPAIYRYRLPR